MQWSVLSEAELGPDDRGLAYGDGLFETIAIKEGRLLRLERHLKRLAGGLERLGIPAAPVMRKLESSLPTLIKDHRMAVAKLIVTRGSSARGYRPPAEPKPVIQLGVGSRPEIPDTQYLTGVRVGFCRTPVSHAPHLAGIKHLNRLDQVMAAAECASDWDEGLMFDPDGYLIGGTKTNIFLLKGGGLLTPRLDRCGVAGIMRDIVIAAADKQGIPLREMRLRRSHLQDAEGVFLTNTLVGAWPVAHIEAQSYPIPALLEPLRWQMDQLE